MSGRPLKIYHIERNLEIPLRKQKKQIEAEYEGVILMQSDGRQITVFAEGRRDG